MPEAREKAVFKGAELIALQVIAAVGADPAPALEVVEVLIGAIKGRLDVFRHPAGRAATRSLQILWPLAHFVRPKTATRQPLAVPH